MTTKPAPRTPTEAIAYRCMMRLPAAARFAENARPAIDDALSEAYALGLAAGRASPDQGEALREALTVIEAGLAAENDELGDYWQARKWMERRGLYEADLEGPRVLLEVARAALRSPPPEDEGPREPGCKLVTCTGTIYTAKACRSDCPKYGIGLACTPAKGDPCGGPVPAPSSAKEGGRHE